MTPSTAQAVLMRANEALQQGEWETALASFQSLLSEHETAEAYEGLSWAAWWLNDGSMSIGSREAAYRLYRQSGDDTAAARMAMWLAMDHGDFRGERAIANGWRERARHLLEEQPVAPEHGWRLVLECWAPILVVEDPHALKRSAAEATAVSRHCGDTDLAIVARAMEGLALVSEGRVAEGMTCLDEAAAAALGGELHQEVWKIAIFCFLVDACERVRDLRRAAEWCEQMRELVDRVRLVGAQGICRAHLGALLTQGGDWREAEATLAEAHAYFAASRPPWEPEAAVRLAELRRRQGRGEDALALLRRAEWHPLAALGFARLALEDGRLADAEDWIDRYLRQVPPDNRLERVPGVELRVRLSTALGDTARAGEALGELEATAEAVGSSALRGAACLAKATVADAAGERARAKACLEDAVACFAESGMPYEGSLARLQLAEVLASLGRPERAAEEARAARARLEALGATTAVQQAGALLADLDRRAAGRTGATPGRTLSRRQLEVLRLVAAGKTNKAIAAELCLSEKTIDRHLSNIYYKLGVASRAAATAYAYEHDLI